MNMRNKIFYVLLVLMIGFFCCKDVYAEELDFTLMAVANKTEVVKGRDVTVTINLKSDVVIANCSFGVETDSGIVYSSYENINAWTAHVGTNIMIENNNLNDESPLAAGGNILKLKYKVNESGMLKIKNIKCVSLNKVGVDADGNKTEIEGSFNDISLDLVAIDSVEDTTLSGLTVTGGAHFEFSPTKYRYATSLSSPTFGLQITTSDSQFQEKIVVTDENGTVLNDYSNITYSTSSGNSVMPLYITVNGKTTYELAVRYVEEELDNSLSSLTINGETIALTKGQYSYKYTVAADVTEVVIAATIKDTENFKFGGSTVAPGTFTIKDSLSTIIVVEPKKPGGVSATYAITVIKEGNDEGEKNDGTVNGSSGSGNSGGNAGENPASGDAPMYFMAFILIISLVGSVVVYRKNIEGYK